MTELGQIGLVVHPTRNVAGPLAAVRQWAEQAGAAVTQVPVAFEQPELAEPGQAEDCDLLVAIGGDGTALAAMRVAVPVDRPVLGIACGSLGVLTSVAASGVADALSDFCADRSSETSLPGLRINFDGDRQTFALNDIAVVRAGQGQVLTIATVDEALIGRFAGDGCIVSAPLGSSAYALAAGGPLLTPAIQAFVLTPLTVHGGFCPPVVLAPDARLELTFTAGHGGARLEVDGQVAGPIEGSAEVRLDQGVARVLAFAGQESFLEGLRRRKIIIDSPRILAEDAREG